MSYFQCCDVTDGVAKDLAELIVVKELGGLSNLRMVSDSVSNRLFFKE